MSTPLNIVCISRYFKGSEFIRTVKSEGHNVYLLTSSNLKDEAWPWESITETFYMDEDETGKWNMAHVRAGLGFKLRTIKFHVFVALDDFDVEKVAHLREHFRVPGMGETTSRYFRDKLAMRIKAKEEGILVPDFTPLFNDDEVRHFTLTVPAPWVIKPRSAASAMGVKKLHTAAELWQHLEELGDQRHNYLLERFAPGDVYHVDSLCVDKKVVFARVSQYLDTPMEVAQGGGIFRSQTVKFGSPDDKALLKANKALMKAFHMNYSACHTEFIKGKEDGQYYFLETASRVGGANIAEMVEASSGINLWAEWAKLEIAKAQDTGYQLPKIQKNPAGIVVSLSRYEHPDTSSFTDAEICWRMQKPWHIGLIVKTKDSQEKVRELLDAYTERIARGFHASLPPEAPPV
ncbi:MAG: ATPase [Bacteroidota bacterium]